MFWIITGILIAGVICYAVYRYNKHQAAREKSRRDEIAAKNEQKRHDEAVKNLTPKYLNDPVVLKISQMLFNKISEDIRSADRSASVAAISRTYDIFVAYHAVYYNYPYIQWDGRRSEGYAGGEMRYVYMEVNSDPYVYNREPSLFFAKGTYGESCYSPLPFCLFKDDQLRAADIQSDEKRDAIQNAVIRNVTEKMSTEFRLDPGGKKPEITTKKEYCYKASGERTSSTSSFVNCTSVSSYVCKSKAGHDLYYYSIHYRAENGKYIRLRNL